MVAFSCGSGTILVSGSCLILMVGNLNAAFITLLDASKLHHLQDMMF